jgi:hypothetical protein
MIVLIFMTLAFAGVHRFQRLAGPILKQCLETPRYQFVPCARCQMQKLTAWKFARVLPIATLKLSQFPHMKKGWRPIIAMALRCSKVRDWGNADAAMLRAGLLMRSFRDRRVKRKRHLIGRRFIEQ